MFADEDEEVMRRFYTDLINAAVFNTPLSFVEKYPQITDYEVIAHSEREVLRLLYLAVSKDFDRVAKIAEMLSEEGVNERVSAVIATVAAAKFSEIRRELLRREICRGGPCLLDHNWRIVNVLSSNWTASSNKGMLGLTLIIEQRNTEKKERRINLQLDVHEAEQLLTKLKEMKVALKA